MNFISVGHNQAINFDHVASISKGTDPKKIVFFLNISQQGVGSMGPLTQPSYLENLYQDVTVRDTWYDRILKAVGAKTRDQMINESPDPGGTVRL